MSFRRLVPLVAILAVFAMALRFSIGPDTYWHLRSGDWILSEGGLPRLDPFSLTQLGAEWVYPGWLAQVVLISVHRLLGYPGLNFLTAIAVAAAFGFVWKTMTGRPLLRAFVLLFAAVASAVYWSARPHILTFLFTAITLWALAKFRREGSRVIWLVPVLTAVWANVHGGFVVPILLISLEIAATLVEVGLPKLRIAIFGTGIREALQGGKGASQAGGNGAEADAGNLGAERTGAPGVEGARADLRAEGHSGRYAKEAAGLHLKTLLLAGLASLAAVLLNPFGVKMIAYPFRTVSIGVLQDYIQEWQSPDFHQPEVQPYLLLLLIVLGAMALSPKRPAAIELIHVAVFAYLGFLAARNIALFALVAAPPLSRHLDAILTEWLPPRELSRELSPRLTRPLNVVLLVLLAILVLIKGARPLSRQFNRETIAENMPARAAEFLRSSRPEGPLFNSYNWGGYVLWDLFPQYLSFVDGRTDLFDDAVLEEYLRVWRADDGWQESVRAWDIQTVLIEHDAPLVRELTREGWIPVYEDDLAKVFTRPN